MQAATTRGGTFATPLFERFAGIAAIVVAAGAILYSILFIAVVEGAGEGVTELWFFVLMLGGLATIPVMIAVYGRLREAEPGLGLTALILGLGSSFGGILHGAYELGSLVTPIPGIYGPGPEAVSHGILRYGIAGVALLLIAWLIHRTGAFPRVLAYLGYLGGALLVFIYIGRLYDFIQPDDYVSLIPPILYGFVVHPLWYLGIGWALWRAWANDGPLSGERRE